MKFILTLIAALTATGALAGTVPGKLEFTRCIDSGLSEKSADASAIADTICNQVAGKVIKSGKTLNACVATHASDPTADQVNYHWDMEIWNQYPVGITTSYQDCILAINEIVISCSDANGWTQGGYFQPSVTRWKIDPNHQDGC